MGGLTEAIDGIAWYGVGGSTRVWISGSCRGSAWAHFPHVASMSVSRSRGEMRLCMGDVSCVAEGELGDR